MKQLSLLEPIEIQLTKGYVTCVDPADADLADLSWYALIASAGPIYAVRSAINDGVRVPIKLHRVVLARMLNVPCLSPLDLVDHIDGNGLNNTRSNLRLANRLQNSRNAKRRKDNTSGYKGVTKHGNKWEARIELKRKKIHLGVFPTPEAAYDAYCKAAKELYGEFARLK